MAVDNDTYEDVSCTSTMKYSSDVAMLTSSSAAAIRILKIHPFGFSARAYVHVFHRTAGCQLETIGVTYCVLYPLSINSQIRKVKWESLYRKSMPWYVEAKLVPIPSVTLLFLQSPSNCTHSGYEL